MGECIHLYLDESGNLGKMGRYFVIAAIETENVKPLYNVMKKAVLKTKKTFPKFEHKQEVKASESSPSIKQFFLEKIASKENIQIRYIVADKHYVKPRLLEDSNLLYNYMLKFLITPVAKQPGLKQLCIILDKRTIKVQSANSFEDYIKLELCYELGLDLDVSVRYVESQTCYAVQAADFVSNAVYAKYEHKETYYWSIIRPKIAFSDHFPRVHFGQ